MKRVFLFGAIAISTLMVGCSSTETRDCDTKACDKAAICADAAKCNPADCDKEKCTEGVKACASEGKSDCCGSCGGDEAAKECCGTCGGGEHSHADGDHSHD
jgi:hypothetical protein